MQQIQKFPSVLPEIVWGALDWFLSYEIWILILTTLCIFDEENGYIFGMFVENFHIFKTLHEFYF